MICPKCGSEYVDGVSECADCGVPLADPPVVERREDPVEHREDHDLDLQVVLTAGRADILALAKSILQSAGVEFCVTGEEVQDLFGYGRFPGGFNVAMGPIRILVRREDAADARALLGDLGSTESEPEASEEDPGEPVQVLSTRARRLARVGGAILLASAALGIVSSLIGGWLGR